MAQSVLSELLGSVAAMIGQARRTEEIARHRAQAGGVTAQRLCSEANELRELAEAVALMLAALTRTIDERRPAP
jgi:hypothetical protein